MIDGIVFDSKKEAARWCELKLLEKAGEIQELHRQVVFELIPAQKKNGKTIERAVNYIADFVYLRKDFMPVIEDVKGIKTDVYRLKKKILLWRYGLEIKEV